MARSFCMVASLRSWDMKRRLAVMDASWGMTLAASLPAAMVKAQVVWSMAPAWALNLGRSDLSRGLKSQRFASTSRKGMLI